MQLFFVYSRDDTSNLVQLNQGGKEAKGGTSRRGWRDAGHVRGARVPHIPDVSKPSPSRLPLQPPSIYPTPIFAHTPCLCVYNMFTIVRAKFSGRTHGNGCRNGKYRGIHQRPFNTLPRKTWLFYYWKFPSAKLKAPTFRWLSLSFCSRRVLNIGRLVRSSLCITTQLLSQLQITWEWPPSSGKFRTRAAHTGRRREKGMFWRNKRERERERGSGIIHFADGRASCTFTF